MESTESPLDPSPSRPRFNRRTVLRIALSGAGTLAAASLLAACGTTAPNAPAAPAGTSATTGTPLAAGAPTAGGDLVVGVAASYIDVLDPNVTAQTVTHEVMQPIFDTLLVQETQTGNFFPGLATKWDVTPDGLTFTFTLRSGVKFHDGTPFDAAAVKANLDRAAAPETKSRLAGPRLSGYYDSTEVVDPATVKIHFKQPNGAFLTDLSQDFMAMLSPTAVSKYGPDQIGQHPVGTGPFTFVEWVQNDHITLARNEDYNWASSMFKHQGAAYLKSIIYKIIPEDSARVTALQSGQVNFIDTVPTVNFATIKSDPKFTVYSVQQPGIPYVYMLNTKRAPTDELAVRQAINYAIDKKAIIQTLYQDLYTPAYGPLSPASFGYNPAVETIYTFDPAKAKQLLDGAGWTVGSDGVRVKNGNRLEINHYVFTDNKVATVMQAQLKAIGMQSNVTLLDVGAVNEAATRGEVANLAPLPYRDADPAVLGVALAIKNEGKGFAWTFHKNQQLDSELNAGQATVDLAERKKHYGAAQVMAMNDALLIPIYNSYGLQAAAASVQGVSFDLKGVDPWVYEVWLKTK
jgi:peptide/nickel transport system substrate-binding protein